jgi:hypothetical protein
MIMPTGKVATSNMLLVSHSHTHTHALLAPFFFSISSHALRKEISFVRKKISIYSINCSCHDSSLGEPFPVNKSVVPRLLVLFDFNASRHSTVLENMFMGFYSSRCESCGKSWVVKKFNENYWNKMENGTQTSFKNFNFCDLNNFC